MNEITTETNDLAIDSVIKITTKAVEQMQHIYLQESKKENFRPFIRVSVIGGGCSGLSYKISFDEQKPKDHHITITEGTVVVIDPKSAVYLQGTTLDFEDGLEGKGFVFKNPNAKNTCGCGESFSL